MSKETSLNAEVRSNAGKSSVKKVISSGKIPSDECPEDRRFVGIFPADNLPRNEAEEDNLKDAWWQEIEIDKRTGLLPTFDTPLTMRTKELKLTLSYLS